jgi:hypothetical protein
VHQIAFAHNADELTIAIDDRNAADPVIREQFRKFLTEASREIVITSVVIISAARIAFLSRPGVEIIRVRCVRTLSTPSLPRVDARQFPAALY